MKLLTDVELMKVCGWDNIQGIDDYERDIAKAQLAKDEARHEADKVKVREQTLREVGEWLYSLCPHTTDPLQQRKLCRLCVSTLAEELFWGRMP
jgi:hypothetical protein